jgi:hypothetical protein
MNDDSAVVNYILMDDRPSIFYLIFRISGCSVKKSSHSDIANYSHGLLRGQNLGKNFP